MRGKTSCFIFCLTLFACLLPGMANAAPERRTALVIGNGAYDDGRLANPVIDASDMAATLQALGFQVSLKKNVSLREMEEAAAQFSNELKKGEGKSCDFSM